MKKKIISISVCLSIAMTFIVPAMATNRVYESDLWISDENVLSEFVSVDTPLRNSENLAAIEDEVQNEDPTVIENGVQYDYVMSANEDGGAYVSLDYSIDLGDQVLNFTVDGYVESAPYGEDDIFYEGKLEGDKTINGINYKVVAGIQKLESSDNIRVGVVMKPTYDGSEYVIMIFGDEVLSQEEMETYISGNTSPNPYSISDNYGAGAEIAPMNAYDDYTLFCSTPLRINEQGVNTYSAGTMYYYFALEPLRGILGLRSNCAGVANLLSDNQFFAIVDVYNAYFEVKTIRGNGYIDSFENSVVYPRNSSFNINDTFRSGLSDIISYIASFSPVPIPTFFIDWIGDSLTGRVITSDDSGSRLTAEFQFTGILDSADFDDGLLPVTYQFDAGTGGRTECECILITEYRCRVINTMNDTSTTLYLETDPCTYNWSFTA